MATTDPKPAFSPYVPATESPAEFTLKAIVIGVLFGLLFGASTVYLGLRAGLTVSASIPIAVLAISVLKRLGGSTILENNIVQTIGSAGESVAGGVVFTIPALIFLTPYGPGYFNYYQISMLAFAGGILGVLMMVPLRRALIVKEHGVLPYPEGTACADVLIAGEKGGKLATMVFGGVGIGALWKSLSWVFNLFLTELDYSTPRGAQFPNATLNVDISPEYMGVGYVIGPRIAGTMFAGGVLSWLVLLPLLTILGAYMTVPFPPIHPNYANNPATGMPFLISEMAAGQLWSAYIRYIGAGAVLAAGLITLGRTLPTIIASAREGLKDFGAAASGVAVLRTERDIPTVAVLIGSLLLAVFLAVAPKMPMQGNFLAAILVIVFGFLFVTVSSRITGLIGTSSNPISGMTIATLILTCLVFVFLGWTGDAYGPIAISVGAIVCIAAANAGGTSQDLKTGYLVGATPYYQQLGLVIGVITSAAVIGATTLYLHRVFGIGSAAIPAPQATLMATIIKGLLSQNLPWGLVLVGVFISIALELCGIRSLSFAVGSYLPIATTAPIFVGGLVRWYVERKTGAPQESDVSSGTLFSSGLIAGGSLCGILFAILVGTGHIAGPQSIGNYLKFLHDGVTGYVASATLFIGLAMILGRQGQKKNHLRKLALVLTLAAATVSAQPATRKPTNIAALKAYPSFFHNRPILVVGTVATSDKGITVTDDNGSFKVLFKGSAPDGLDEIRGEFWDIGRMKADEPQLSGYDMLKTFGVDPNGPWPRPGEVTAIIATNISQAVAPATPSIRALTLYPTRFLDQKVTITGQFSGRNLFGDLPDAPGKGRFDFVIRSADSAIWVTGAQPKGKGFNFALDSRLDSGRWLEVTGTVKAGRGLTWLDVKDDGIQLGKAPTEAPPVEAAPVRIAPAPRPEVVFSAPTQDETDVSMSTSVRIQFSRDIDQATLKGHIKAHYIEAQTIERGEPTTPAAEFTMQYTAPTRVLELKFTRPLERFRTIHIDLTDEIIGTDKQPLKPWTLSFDLGGG